jgi:hypothetical protein
MTYQDIVELGLKTIATDTNSFVSRTTDDDVWLELFYCVETNYLQIMRGTKGDKGETLRNTIYEGKGDIGVIKQFIK